MAKWVAQAREVLDNSYKRGKKKKENILHHVKMISYEFGRFCFY